MLCAVARHVRDRAVDGIDAAAWCWRATAWESSRCFSREQGRDLYFASELKAIFVHPEVERNLNLAALDCYLALNYVPAPYTLVEGIEKLRPGHWLEWQRGKTRSEAYWQMPRGVDQHWTLDGRDA